MNRRNFLKAAVGAAAAAVVLPEIVAEAAPVPAAPIGLGYMVESTRPMYHGIDRSLLFDICDSNGNVKETIVGYIDPRRGRTVFDYGSRRATSADLICPHKNNPLA